MPGYDKLGHGLVGLPGARRDFWFHAAAALLAAGDDAMLTGASALYALGVLQHPPRVIDVAVPEGKGSRKRRGFRVRRGSHLGDQPVLVKQLRTVPLPYAVGDYARDAKDDAVAHALSRGMAFDRFGLDEVVAVTDERGQFPGSARLRRVLRDFDGVETHSKRERKLAGALAKRGVKLHDGPLRLRNKAGRVIAKTDLAVMDVRLDIEVDGPHHFLPEQQRKDRIRDRDMLAIGWHVIRFSVYEIDADVERVADRIVSLIERLRAGASAA